MIVVGQGCEWRIDPKTGLAGVHGGHHAGGNGRAHALPPRPTAERISSSPAPEWAFTVGPLHIFQRLGEGKYKLRTAMVFYADEAGKELPIPPSTANPRGAKRTILWADANDDGQRQPGEISGIDGELRFSGWYMGLTPDATLYSEDKQFKLQGLSPCGASHTILTKPTKMPAAGLGSADGRLVLTFNRRVRYRS